MQNHITSLRISQYEFRRQLEVHHFSAAFLMIVNAQNATLGNGTHDVPDIWVIDICPSVPKEVLHPVATQLGRIDRSLHHLPTIISWHSKDTCSEITSNCLPLDSILCRSGNMLVVAQGSKQFLYHWFVAMRAKVLSDFLGLVEPKDRNGDCPLSITRRIQCVLVRHSAVPLKPHNLSIPVFNNSLGSPFDLLVSTTTNLDADRSL